MHIHPTERRYILFSGGLILAFAVAILISSVAYGIQVPGQEMRVDPRTVATDGTTPFSLPEEERVRELAPGEYEAYVLAKTWAFEPRDISIPAGSTITFYVTSQDVMHGFKLQKTNMNIMILPGQVSRVTVTLDEPGTYDFICHEYCGIAHHTMYGQVIVE